MTKYFLHVEVVFHSTRSLNVSTLKWISCVKEDWEARVALTVCLNGKGKSVVTQVFPEGPTFHSFHGDCQGVLKYIGVLKEGNIRKEIFVSKYFVILFHRYVHHIMFLYKK